MARSLNRAQLLGNLTRDPELRYTPNGAAVCSFGLATNRNWTTETGEKHEEVEFHKIVAWNKLAELCSQFLTKGRKVYVEGRLATRNWTGQDGNQRTTTEIVIDDMILVDSKRPVEQVAQPAQEEAVVSQTPKKETAAPARTQKSTKKKDEEVDKKEEEVDKEEVAPEDIPF